MQSLGRCESAWKRGDLISVWSTGENRMGMINSIPGPRFLNIFKIYKSHSDCLGAIEISVIENVEKLWDSHTFFGLNRIFRGGYYTMKILSWKRNTKQSRGFGSP